uniref:TIR domain-containing protein n=1 Tax=Kalanchoe fedtschenkoi TaxID=63787 RepID=A0A7N0VGX8_KALFE
MVTTTVEESSKCPKMFEHQVFLSFRGPDTRIFTGHLFNALKKAGFRVFLDNDGLEHGRDIQEKLYEAIKRSEMSVVILSRGYAASRWCLDELVKIMELHDSHVHSVLPVFYDVEPTVVRNQTGVYEGAFMELQGRFGGDKERILKWRSALNRVAALKGLSLNAERDESLLAENITQEVRKMVKTSLLYVPPNIIGRDLILEEINTWLQDGSQGVEIGLIYGLGGIGKSTITQIAYNHNASKFDGCSFLENFTRKTTQGDDGLACLLEQVILDVTGKPGTKIYNVAKGMQDVSAILSGKRVLIVLDDVDELEYLPDAFDDPRVFGKGSKIIITSRNKELKRVSLFKRKFKISELNDENSKQILKSNALIKDPLSQRQEELLDKFVQYCHGIPLALYIMGPLLRKGKEAMWEEQLKELKKYSHPKILSVFRLSFEGIGDELTKELFLFIACFFVQTDKDHSLTIMEACNLKPISGLQSLVNRCLVTVNSNNKLMMPRSIEEMGKEMAREEAINEPGHRSKLWNTKDSLSVLQNQKGTSNIRGLRLDLPRPDNNFLSKYRYTKQSDDNFGLASIFSSPPQLNNEVNLRSIKTSAFTMMCNLELLLLNNVKLEGGYKSFPKTMKWLLWRCCPLKSLPSDLNLSQLVVLDMQNSCLVHAWEGWKKMSALKILNLSYSYHLLSTPDLSSALFLESISLEGCTSLVEVHGSIGNLRNLMHLNMKDCGSLATLHISIENLMKLTTLNLAGCRRLMNFPFNQLCSLEGLDLTECKSLFQAPYQMGSVHRIPSVSSFTTLKKLRMASCDLSRDDIFDWISRAPSLKFLDLSDNPFRVLNIKDETDGCMRLEKLHLEGCTQLQSISQLTDGCEVLVTNCCSLKRIAFASPNVLEPCGRRLISARRCDQLVEIQYNPKEALVFEAISEMDDDRATYLGFPNLKALSHKNPNLKNFETGFYQGGIYTVYLWGDQLSKWFDTTTPWKEEVIQHTIPSLPSRPIRGLKFGSVCKRKEPYWLLVKDQMKMENLERMWEWRFVPPMRYWLLKAKKANKTIDEGEANDDDDDDTITWLSHWCVAKNREIRAGDILRISVPAHFPTQKLKWGIQIVYEEQHVDVQDDLRKSVDCRGSSRSQIVSWCNRTANDEKIFHKQEGMDSSNNADAWYNNTFRSPLSLFEPESRSQNDKNQPRKFGVYNYLFW